MLLFALFGRAILEIVFPGIATLIFHACLITLAGNGALAAAEPFTRVLLGLGFLQQIFLSKLSILIVTLGLIYILHGPALTRYSTSYSLGCVAGAAYISLAYLGFLMLNKSRVVGNE
jgi:hypothetical protein